MSRRPETKSSTPEDTRALILETALRLFSRNGFFNTSVQDIRKEADISIGSIYHHFSGKEAIAKAIYLDLLGKIDVTMRDILSRHSTAHDRCREVVVHLFSMTDAFPEAMEYILHARHREFMTDGIPICSSGPFARMKQMVEEGMESGEILPMDPLVATTSLFGGPIRLIHLRLDGILKEEISSLLEPTWLCAWKSVSK